MTDQVCIHERILTMSALRYALSFLRQDVFLSEMQARDCRTSMHALRGCFGRWEIALTRREGALRIEYPSISMSHVSFPFPARQGSRCKDDKCAAVQGLRGCTGSMEAL